MRSGLRPANSCCRAARSSPMSAVAGSRTSSRNSRYCRSGMTMSISSGSKAKPGVPTGTTNSAGRSLPVLASAVRPAISTASASSTPEM